MATRASEEKYVLVTLAAGPEAVEAGSAVLFDLGVDGVVEEADGAGAYLKAYFEATDWVRLVRRLKKKLAWASAEFPSLRLVNQEPARLGDYLERWKEFHRPVIIGPLWVGPPWQMDQAEPGLMKLIVDPGHAFGTGAHETTRLCLEALIGLSPKSQGQSLLDVGTGSGVLALAGLKLGFGPVLALDNDPLALESAVQNAELNGLGQALTFSDRPTGEVHQEFDTVVANLTGPLLIKMAPDIRRLTRSGGWAVLSGLLNTEEKEVLASFETGFTLQSSDRKGEWTGLTLVRT